MQLNSTVITYKVLVITDISVTGAGVTITVVVVVTSGRVDVVVIITDGSVSVVDVLTVAGEKVVRRVIVEMTRGTFM